MNMKEDFATRDGILTKESYRGTHKRKINNDKLTNEL